MTIHISIVLTVDNNNKNVILEIPLTLATKILRP